MDSSRNNAEGFTGLEAAIVLIAFIVVAAVFSYMVLGADLTATRKSDETIRTDISSPLRLSGPVSVQAGAASAVSHISFYLQIAAGSNPVDMTPVAYTISTRNMVKTVQGSDSAVTRTFLKEAGRPDNVLEPGETVLVDLDTGAMGFSAGGMTMNDTFIVEIKLPAGPALRVERTVPASLVQNRWYEVS
jgi:flagellin FlaB